MVKLISSNMIIIFVEWVLSLITLKQINRHTAKRDLKQFIFY
jgi:hypothetical protein